MAKKDKDMIAEAIPYHRSPGRPIKLGKFIINDDIPGGVGVFAGHCRSCNDKVVLPRLQVIELCKMFWQEQNSWRSMLVRFLNRKLRG